MTTSLLKKFAVAAMLAGTFVTAHAALKVGDALQLVQDERGYALHTPAGQAVGRLSQHFTPPAGQHCLSARVHALLTWRKRDSAAEYQHQCQCEAWEVVVPELVFGSG